MTYAMNSKKNAPIVLVIGLHNKDELEVIKGIVDENKLHPEQYEGTDSYKWCINNKYYTSEVLFSVIQPDCNITTALLNSAEAVVVYIDPMKESAFEDLDETCKERHNLEVKLLVCDGFLCENSLSAKQKATAWCIKHGWELVELNVESSDDSDSDSLEDDFVDSYGFTRLKQALNAHTWQNLKLKDSGSSNLGNLVRHMTLSDSNGPEIPYQPMEPENSTSEDVGYPDLDNEFDSLFTSLGDMKQRAESLPTEERRDYAEKVAMAFLKSLGEDDGE